MLLKRVLSVEGLLDVMVVPQDVLVATDVASKGLDFPEIQHVINFDMPDEIENYVHRIGRTGRCGKTGIATTFINKNQVCLAFVLAAEAIRVILILSHLYGPFPKKLSLAPSFIHVLQDILLAVKLCHAQ